VVKKIIFQIDERTALMRLDKALALCTEVGTRSRAAKLIELKQVSLNSKLVKPSYITQIGEVFEIEIREQPTSLEALDIPLEIVFEDSELLVVNKPAGLVVHPSEGHAQDTLVNALLHHTSDLAMGFGENRPGIVHRLDRDTSGLLVVAKNDFAHENLAKQFRARSVHRLYWALVVGHIKVPQARIESLLGRHPTNRKKFSTVVAGGKTAITNYTLVSHFTAGLSLLHVKLETGRTHQIRVHLSERGNPVVGDKVYGPNQEKRIKSGPALGAIKSLNRIGLHAAELGFAHPKTGQEMAFRAGWPSDMQPLIELLKQESK
jgi:23S rRNA pseudouridine1911/1915/1917 synthase